VVNTAVKWFVLLAIAYFGCRTLNGLAGQKTFADIGIKFLADIKVSQTLAWTLAVGATYIGHRQRRLRLRTVEVLHRRIEKLETMLDSRRSTSSLTRRGETRPEDR
jgi:hypothetical protein